MENLIFSLDAETLPAGVAGGKGVNLNRLIRAGLPVPGGFVISTAAYRQFVSANDLQTEIARLSEGNDGPAAMEQASQQIRDLFATAALPDNIRDEISQAALGFAGRAVAVRSSATAEDLPEASFAGQQESYLNVRGLEALLEAVRMCWSSLWTARAMAYRGRQAIAPSDVALAVVVQEMVAPESAGVLFTVNPLTGNRQEMLVNATWGLGESLVAGRVNPDSLVLDKASGAIKELQIGGKAVMTAPVENGTEEIAVPAARQAEAALTSEQASALAGLARQAEALFDSAQDIEWALANGGIILLQSRPVTVVAGVEDGRAPGDDLWPPRFDAEPQPFDRWSQMDVGERWPEPVTPFTWSTAEPMMAQNMARADTFKAIKAPFTNKIRWARREYGRVYFNEGAMVQLVREGYGMPASSVSEAMGGQTEDQGDGDGYRWGTFIRRLPAVAKMSLKWERDLKAYPDLFPLIDDWVNTFMARDLSPAGDAQLWAESQSVWYTRLIETMDLHSVATSAASNNVGMLKGFVKRTTGDEQLTYQLMSGLNDVIAAEIVPALWQMADTLRALNLADIVLGQTPGSALAELQRHPEGQPFRAQLETFLSRHGHRCRSEAEWLYPRWIEAPALVIEAIAGYLRAGDQHNPLASEDKQRQKREQATAEIENSLDPLRRAYFRWALRRAQNTILLRDNGQHYLVKLLLPMRVIYATLGRRWAEMDWLAEADDFFFLVVPEIEATIFAGNPAKADLDLKEIVAGRRLAHDHWRQAGFPETLGADGRPVRQQSEDGASILSGIPASGGRASGKAAVINTPAEAGRVETGQILVTRSTDPGWTPLFSIVGGLVLEVGGQLSHGAIVAREYGLPAVVNVADATGRIAEGQEIVVDGTNGKVYLAEVEQGSAGAGEHGSE